MSEEVTFLYSAKVEIQLLSYLLFTLTQYEIKKALCVLPKICELSSSFCQLSMCFSCLLHREPRSFSINLSFRLRPNPNLCPNTSSLQRAGGPIEHCPKTKPRSFHCSTTTDKETGTRTGRGRETNRQVSQNPQSVPGTHLLQCPVLLLCLPVALQKASA